MTYRCGIGPGLPIPVGTPQITCDAPGCSARVVIAPGRLAPPVWFLDGKAPPRWKMKRTEDGRRRDWCPKHKEAAE